MIGLLSKQLFRSKGLLIGLFMIFGIGLLSIHIGKDFVDRQEDVIALTELAQKEHIGRHVQYEHSHIGLLLYYIKFGFSSDVSPMSGLSIGQKDIRQAAQLVNIRNLEEQKNTQELNNPYFQLLGSLDFSFVLIVLFPLIIIALCFNLWSEEKESGRWSLIAVQSIKPRSIILAKIGIRIAIVIIKFLFLLTIAILYLSIPIDFTLIGFTSISILYLLFWFSLSWWVTSLEKSSMQNAIILLALWGSLIFVLPSITNNAISYLYPIPEAYETTIDSRDGYHTKWDKPKAGAIDKFKILYPQYQQYEHPEDASFSWFWYYAMQHMGDAESVDARKVMKDKLHKRNNTTRWIGYFVPSIHTQLSLNSLSRTDMANKLNYMDALESFHEELRLSFYNEVFDETPIENIDWSRYGISNFDDQRDYDYWMFLPLILINILLLGFSYLSTETKKNHKKAPKKH